MSAAEVDLIVPVRPCTPWCEKGEGHGDEHPEDRTCWSDYQRLILSHEHHRPSHYTDGTWKRPYLNVYLRRRYEEAEGHLVIHSDETDQELCLTRAEALGLRDMLDGLIDTVLSTGEPPVVSRGALVEG